MEHTSTQAALERQPSTYRTETLSGGNIFHAALDWPFLEDDAPRAAPAERWGVDTAHPRVLRCGAGAQRGGGVSGIGGHNAAMAVLENL